MKLKKYFIENNLVDLFKKTGVCKKKYFINDSKSYQSEIAAKNPLNKISYAKRN
jgi:hypothetical protein